MTQPTELTALQVLYSLAKRDEPADLWTLARALDTSCREAGSLLAALDAHGLVDARRVRLTMAGLALAVSTRGLAARRRRGCRALRRAA
jgi:Mn-dependent DtxR family transcriptional regulator